MKKQEKSRDKPGPVFTFKQLPQKEPGEWTKMGYPDALQGEFIHARTDIKR